MDEHSFKKDGDNYEYTRILISHMAIYNVNIDI